MGEEDLVRQSIKFGSKNQKLFKQNQPLDFMNHTFLNTMGKTDANGKRKNRLQI